MLICLASATAGTSDSLLYRSAFERSQVRHAVSNEQKADFFSLFASIDSDSIETVKYASKLNNFYDLMASKQVGLKAGKQKAKLLFKEVHNYFFKKYEENVFFSKIFREGIYNCVTASMLYAIVLTHYDVPFEIKETPTHVYLVAFPGSDNIMFETTSPKGFYVPDERFKREYVAGLVQLKFTSQEYVDQIGSAKAFNEFYYSKGNISLRELAGIQYYNQSVGYHTVDNVDDAVKSIMKTTLLHPSEKNNYYKLSLLGSKLSNSTMNTPQDILYLCEYANASKDLQEKNHVLSFFGNMLDTHLIKQGNDSLINSAYNIISANFKDESIKREIEFTYNLGLTYWHSTNSNFDESINCAKRAYAINSKDARLHELILRSVIFKTEKLKGNKQSIGQLEQYAADFPHLKSNKVFKSMLAYQHAFQAYSEFLANNETEGYAHMNSMEKQLEELKDDSIVGQDLIGMVYAEAGAFHFRKKNYKMAKEIILTGLKRAPDHGELKERLEIVENEMTK
jgi:hypothetical protein